MAMKSVDLAATYTSTGPVNHLLQPAQPVQLATTNRHGYVVIKTYCSQWAIDRAMARGAVVMNS